MVMIAQISDLHIMAPGKLARGNADTAQHLERCVRHILALSPRPDALIASGDLTDHGSEIEYRRLRTLLAPLGMPLYLMPGNHDQRTALRAVFDEHRYWAANKIKIYFSFKINDLNIVALDTVMEGADHGALDAAQLAWLACTLSSAREHATLIFMHHPPTATGIACMDAIALEPDSAHRLESIVRRHPQIVQIGCGHVHRPVIMRWAGVPVLVCPSTAFQSAPALDGGDFAASAGELPAYQLHLWQSNHLITHTITVPQ